jgi:hypothetical protein
MSRVLYNLLNIYSNIAQYTRQKNDNGINILLFLH